MIKAIITDSSRTLLFPKDPNYTEGLNKLHTELSKNGEYNFWEYFELNASLIDWLKNHVGGIPIYIFTSEYIQEHPPLRDAFADFTTAVYSAARMGVNKSDASAYQELLSTLNLAASEAIYIDDNSGNCSAAEAAGLNVVQFTSSAQAIEEMESMMTS